MIRIHMNPLLLHRSLSQTGVRILCFLTGFKEEIYHELNIGNQKKERPKIERKRINIPSKRQITIPAKFFSELILDKEVDCIYSNWMMIPTQVKQQDSAYSEEILTDLIKQGYSGDELLTEFKKINPMIRPAVEKLIEEAD